MAANRYGRIHHSNSHYINLRFASAKARDDFRGEFDAYHSGHEHDGEVPRFVDITAKDTKGYSSTGRTHGVIHPVKLVVLSNGEFLVDPNEQAEYVTIDGYTLNEIKDYHNPSGLLEYSWYSPPTSCVAPIIVIDNKFVDSNILKRHELSAIFGDMPTDDYQSLLASVEKDGFMDQHIKILDGKVLDGWHRYRAGKELNLLRKLKFQQWDEKDDGDPQAFVLARNIERRHLGASQRAQIVVAFNERFGHGGDRKSDEIKPSNDDLKTREQLAKEAGVGIATIDRAVAVAKEGESEAVIAGEKTAGEVIKARDADRKPKKHKKAILKNMWDTKKQAHTDYLGDSDTDLNQYLSIDDLKKGFVEHNESFADAFTSGMERIDRAHGFQDFQDSAFEVDEFGNAKVDVDDLENENKAIGFYAGDIRQWEREDWSPDANWILPLIEAKKVERGHIAPRPEPKPEPDLKELREQVKAEMPKWKQRYKETGKEESELVSRASFSALIHVLRNWENASSAPLEEGAATAEELERLLKYLKEDYYSFIFQLRGYIRETEQPAPETVPDETSPVVPTDEDEDEAALEDAMNSLMDAAAELDSVFLEDLDFQSPADYDRLCELASVAHECDRAILYQIIHEQDLPEHFRAAEMRQWGTILKRLLEDVESEADWLLKLRNADDEVSSPEADEDTSLAEIDNLPTVKHFLENLNSQVETYIDPIQRDNFSLRVFDALHFDEQEESSELTERQQLAILIDVAHSILVESESTQF